MNGFFERGGSALLHEFRGPLIALGVSLLLALLGRATKSGVACAASGGAGLLAGWFAMSVAPLNLTSRVAADKLTLLAAVALAIGLVAARLRTSQLLSWPLALVALLAAWQLAGWPRTQPELLSAWPAALIVGGAILIAGALASGQAAEPLRPAMGGVVLAAALHIAAAPWTLVLLALVPSAAALPMLAAPRMASLVLLAPLCGVAATAALADVTLGRLSRGGFRLMDAAALSPFAALLLMQFMQARMPPPIAAALAGGIAVGAVWIVANLRWLP